MSLVRSVPDNRTDCYIYTNIKQTEAKDLQGRSYLFIIKWGAYLFGIGKMQPPATLDANSRQCAVMRFPEPYRCAKLIATAP